MASPNIEIFQRGGCIVMRGIVKGKAHDGKEIEEKQIKKHNAESLRIVLAQAATFEKFNTTRKKYVRCYPPKDLPASLLNHPEKNYLVLRGIISVPTLRADGTLLNKPGYDLDAGLYFDAGGIDYGTIAERPTKEDAEAALRELEALIAEFPFVDEASMSVAICRLLTGLIRPTLKTAPLFAYTAPAPRTGKGKLNDMGAMIEKGHEAAVMDASVAPEELEKRLTSAVACGATLITSDNLNGELKSELLCQILTCGTKIICGALPLAGDRAPPPHEPGPAFFWHLQHKAKGNCPPSICRATAAACPRQNPPQHFPSSEWPESNDVQTCARTVMKPR